MKTLSAIGIKLFLLQAATTLTGHFFAKENLTSMGLLIGLYIFAFAVGVLFSNNHEDDIIGKKEVVMGFTLSVFLGVLGSVIVFHTDWSPIIVYLLFALISIAPTQVISFIQKNITSVLDKLKNILIKWIG